MVLIQFGCSQNENLVNISDENPFELEILEHADFVNPAPNGEEDCDGFNPANALFPNNYHEILPTTDLGALIGGLDSTEGVTLHFTEGIHDVQNNDITPATELEFNDFTGGLELVGDGAGCTTIRLVSAIRCVTKVIRIKRSKNITIHNLTIDGNRDNICTSEGGNNIRIRTSQNILIEDICSINANGDALNVGCSDEIVIQDNLFDTANRNGLTLGYNGLGNPCTLRDLLITRNIFGEHIDTQAIDFEHGESYAGVRIRFNDFLERATFGDDQRAMAILRFAKDRMIDNVIELNNFNRNKLGIRESQDIVIQFNNDVGQTRVMGGNSFITIRNNNFDIAPRQIYAPGADFNLGMIIRKSDSKETNNISVNNNDFDITGFERGIEVRNAQNIALNNNDITNEPFKYSQAFVGVRLRANLGNSTSAFLNNNGIFLWQNEVDEMSTNNSSITCTGNNCP